MPFYDQIAEYYDYIFPFNRTQVEFVKGSQEEPYHNKRILDIGCGTGDLAITLSEGGFTVTGIDSDPVMLQKAEDKITNSSVTFTCMDMRGIADYCNPSTFDAVLCFGNTLVHLNSLSEIEAFCKQVRAVLRNNGTFLLQILNYDYILAHNITKLPLIENTTVIFERYYEYYNIKNLMAFKTVLTIKETNKRIETEILLYPLRKHELDMTLRNAGFTDISYYGDFDKSDLKTDSLPLVVEAF